ncbi:uncharacterized protein ACNLHF_001508 [Anomaloglossus baeobatrachus]
MKNLVALLCMISALTGSVISHRCHYCESRNSTTCEESETECLGNRCMTGSQHLKLNGTQFNEIYKGCANESLCGINGSLVVANTPYQFSVHCCSGDLCNNQKFEIPEQNQTENGVKCLSALCIGTLEECKTKKKMNCTGSMNRCLDYNDESRWDIYKLFCQRLH